MAKSSIFKVLEHCKIYPPANLAPPSTTLPLTFLDLPWLFFSPSQPLFFYEYPHSTSHFLSLSLPSLRRSLSITLKHFFPFLGNLVLSSCDDSKKPKIVYNQGDYISFTIQESNGDFRYFTSNYSRNVLEFYPFVPDLATSSNQNLIPLLAIKVTIFPHLGICLGLAYQHVASDGRTFNNFIKTWASNCANSCFLKTSTPSFDRLVIKDTKGLEEKFLKELWKRKSCQEVIIGTKTNVDLSNLVRSTFVVSYLDMEKIKNWVIDKCNKKDQSIPIHLSPYVLTCSFIWVCLVKAQTQMGQGEKYYYNSTQDPNYFGFIAGGLTRLDFSVPDTYFGNCVGFGRSTAIRGELMGEDGIVVAANVIGNMIRKLDKEMFIEAENWISDWEVLFGSEVHVMISGSPKLNLYETDFGWGRPKKIEDISIDKNKAISLIESRNEKGGVEVGLVLPKNQMEGFSSIFVESLKIL